MTYKLTPQSLAVLHNSLGLGKPSLAIIDLHRPENTLRASLQFEPADGKIEVVVGMEHSFTTIRLQAADHANAMHLHDQILAIANGTADTAESGAIGTPTAPAREAFALCDDDEASLRHLARIGGTRHLQCGVSVTVHNPLNATRRDALLTTPGGTAHLQACTAGELYVVAAQHIEAALNAA